MKKHLVAYLAEDGEWEDDGPLGLGTFSGHVEDRSDPDAIWPTIDGASLDVAVSWARERADRVIVRLSGWDQEYSAGAVALDLPPLPTELNLGRRRSAGWEFLDRTTDDDEIDWVVDVIVATFDLAAAPGVDLTPQWPQIRSALRADSRVLEAAAENLRLPVSQSNGAWTADAHTHVATMRVRGRTVADAEAAACTVLDDVAEAVGWTGRAEGAPAFTPAGAYPTGSRAAERNAGFRNGRA